MRTNLGNKGIPSVMLLSIEDGGCAGKGGRNCRISQTLDSYHESHFLIRAHQFDTVLPSIKALSASTGALPVLAV
jgi:hypothetical protein